MGGCINFPPPVPISPLQSPSLTTSIQHLSVCRFPSEIPHGDLYLTESTQTPVRVRNWSRGIGHGGRSVVGDGEGGVGMKISGKSENRWSRCVTASRWMEKISSRDDDNNGETPISLSYLSSTHNTTVLSYRHCDSDNPAFPVPPTPRPPTTSAGRLTDPHPVRLPPEKLQRPTGLTNNNNTNIYIFYILYSTRRHARTLVAHRVP